MTSKLKCPVCPFCSGKLYRSDNCYSCLNDQCLFGDFHFVAKRWNAIIELKQALTQAKQDLEIARKALKAYSSDSGNWWYGYEFQGRYEDYAGEYADKALEQIDHIADTNKGQKK